MGASTSKSVRKLPTKTPSRPTPAWAGARTTIPRPEETVEDDVTPATYGQSRQPSAGPSSGSGRDRAAPLDYGARAGAAPSTTGKAKPGFSGEKDGSECLY